MKDRSIARRIGLLALGVAVAGWAFTDAPARAPRGAGEGPPPPSASPPPGAPLAGPGHEILARLAGVWDARVERRKGARDGVEKSKGVETFSLCCGGLFLLADLEGGTRSDPIRLHGIMGYDPDTGRYTLVRIDARRTTIARGAGSYDRDGNALIFEVSEPDGTGSTAGHREVLAFEGRDESTLTIFAPGPDGREVVTMTIRYRRRD